MRSLSRSQFHSFLVLVIAALVFIGYEARADETAIRGTFKSYIESLQARDGERAAGLVTGATLDHYDQLRIHALRSNEEMLGAHRMIDRMSVYLIRAEWDREDLEQMSGRDIFQSAVDLGWVGDELSALELDTVETNGERARTTIIANGQPAPFGFAFLLEEAVWKIDLSSFFDIAEIAISASLEQSGVTEDQLLSIILSQYGYGSELQQVRRPLAPTSPE